MEDIASFQVSVAYLQIKTHSKYMELTQSPEKGVQASHDWFGFTDLIE